MSGLGIVAIEDETGEQEAALDGPLAELRRQRQALVEQGTKEFAHPGYSGLVITYRRLPSEDTQRILYDGEENPVERNAQLLIEAAERIVFRTGGEEIPIAGGYDRELADKMEIETDPSAEMGEARQIVLGTFGGHEQPMLQHALEVYTWILTLRRAEDQRLVGESPGTQASR